MIQILWARTPAGDRPRVAASNGGRKSLLWVTVLVVSTLIIPLSAGCRGSEATDVDGFELGISRQPPPLTWNRGRLDSLPAYQPSSDQPWQVDLRGHDLSHLDLEGRLTDLLGADFDSKTTWPEVCPSPFDPELIMELGKNPGMGVRLLHERGITGRGVGVAIIDQTLLVNHDEYAERLRHYEETGAKGSCASMHGPAVASIAVGKTVGVAPEADLYFIAAGLGMREAGVASLIDRLLAINRSLPDGQKIRVISISAGFGDGKLASAVEKASAEGILVITCGNYWTHGPDIRYQGLERDPLADPDDHRSYAPIGAVHGSPGLPDILFVPINSRCTAGPTGVSDYAFYRKGGMSWGPPYLAGLYALACQVNPGTSPEDFWKVALATGRPISISGSAGVQAVIVDPVKLIKALVPGT